MNYDTGVSSGGYVPRGNTNARVCNCVGTKNDQPLCPCQMQGVEIRDGRYIKVQDLGPVVDDWYFESREGWGGLG